jgi:hypothetical protein
VKVAFDFTLDDLVDASERTLSRSRVARGWRWQAVAFSALIGGGVVWLARGDLVLGLVGGAVCAGLQVAFLKQNRKARLLRYFRERLGGDGPYRCEVELTPEALVATQNGVRTVRDWSSIDAINDTQDAIEFHSRGAGTLVVRNRAFGSREEWRKFLDTARQYARR